MLQANAQQRKVWVDTDIQFDKFGKDVDDGVALIMLLQDTTVEIVGISLIQNVEHGAEVTQRILGYYADYEIPIYKGTNEASDSYGIETPAVSALAEALKKEKLAVLGLGPATNIANLLKFYPEVVSNISEIVFCAGRTKGAVFLPEGSKKYLPDYNFEKDSASFKRVLEHPSLNILLASYQSASSIYLQKEDIKKLKKRGLSGDKWAYRQMRNWIFGWKVSLKVDGFIPFDAMTIGALLYPEYFEFETLPAQINYRKNDSEFLIKADYKHYLEVAPNQTGRMVRFAYPAKAEYKEKLMELLL